MSKITVTTIAGQTSGSDANTVKIESGDTLAVQTNATVGGTARITGNTTIGGTTVTDSNMLNIQGDGSAVNVGTVFNKTNGTAQIWATQVRNTDNAFLVHNYTGSSTPLIIDTAGNLGLGMTPVALTSNHFVNSLSIGSNGPYILLKDENNANKMRYIANNTGEFQLGQVNDDGSTSKTLHLNVSTDGYTTTPTQPYISLIGNSETEVHTQGSAAVFTNFNEGGTGTTRGITWNSSNGRITVPVAGRYLVNVTIYFWCNNAAFHGGHIRINGTTKQEMGVEFDGVQGGRNDLPTNYSKIFTLAANDYIDFYMNGDVYAGPNHTTCEVTMVG